MEKKIYRLRLVFCKHGSSLFLTCYSVLAPELNINHILYIINIHTGSIYSTQTGQTRIHIVHETHLQVYYSKKKTREESDGVGGSGEPRLERLKETSQQKNEKTLAHCFWDLQTTRHL